MGFVLGNNESQGSDLSESCPLVSLSENKCSVARDSSTFSKLSIPPSRILVVLMLPQMSSVYICFVWVQIQETCWSGLDVFQECILKSQRKH